MPSGLRSQPSSSGLEVQSTSLKSVAALRARWQARQRRPLPYGLPERMCWTPRYAHTTSPPPSSNRRAMKDKQKPPADAGIFCLRDDEVVSGLSTRLVPD